MRERGARGQARWAGGDAAREAGSEARSRCDSACDAASLLSTLLDMDAALAVAPLTGVVFIDDAAGTDAGFAVAGAARAALARGDGVGLVAAAEGGDPYRAGLKKLVRCAWRGGQWWRGARSLWATSRRETTRA